MYDETVKTRIGISDEDMDESVVPENGGLAGTLHYIWYDSIHPLAPKNLRLVDANCPRQLHRLFTVSSCMPCKNKIGTM
jgi:hypothetical protein